MPHCILVRKACHLFAFALLIPLFSAPLFGQRSPEDAGARTTPAAVGSVSALYNTAMDYVKKATWDGHSVLAQPGTYGAIQAFLVAAPNGPQAAELQKVSASLDFSQDPSALAAQSHASPARSPLGWTPAVRSVFGADIVRTPTGDPALKFIGHPDKASGYTKTVEIKMYEGKPAFAVATWHSLGAWTTKSTTGYLLIAKNQVVYEVTGGAVKPEDSFLEPKLVEVHKNGTWHFISVNLKSPERKADYYLGYADSKDLHLYNFLMALLQDFDGTLAQFEAATNLSDPDRQLSAAAHFHRLSNTELVEKVEAEQRAEKEAAKKSGGGDGWRIAGALALGTAQGLSGGGSDSAILQAGAQQAAAIRAVGDQNAAAQQQAQARIAAEQARAAQASQEKEHERLAAEQKQREIAAAQQRAIAAAENSTSTAGGEKVTSGNSSVGSKPVTCTSMNNLVSVRSRWARSCEHEVVTWLTNNSNESVDCVYAFHRNGKFGDSGMTTIPSGQTRGGEGGGMWTCGADSDQVEYACFPHKQNEDQTFACTSRVKW